MKKVDVLAFAERAEEHLLELADDLANGKYAHGQYTRFAVCDPKRREIAKASVRDRVLHHSVHRVLAPLFDQGFIFDSYSSRRGKGTHAAGKRFRKFAWHLSRNHTKTVWVLQLDVRRFFDSVDHEVLLGLLRKRLSKIQPAFLLGHSDPVSAGEESRPFPAGSFASLRMTGEKSLLYLLEIIIRSFEVAPGKGIPLGNLTSQLFSNVYLDPLDQFVKRKLRVKHYLRYADDIAILSHDREYLEDCRGRIAEFLSWELKLELHPKKVTLKRWHEGIDFLGYVHFPFHAVLRTKTKRRALSRVSPKNAASYIGVAKHARSFGLERQMRGILGS